MRRCSQPTWAALACSSARDCAAAVTAAAAVMAAAAAAVVIVTVLVATSVPAAAAALASATAAAAECVANGDRCFAIEWRFFEHFEMSGGFSNV